MLGIFLITMTTSMTKECTCDISNNDNDSKDVLCLWLGHSKMMMTTANQCKNFVKSILKFALDMRPMDAW